MKNDTQEGRRYAEALPHIVVDAPMNNCIKCFKCGTFVFLYSELSEQDRLDFLTAHRHKSITNLEKKEVNK